MNEKVEIWNSEDNLISCSNALYSPIADIIKVSGGTESTKEVIRIDHSGRLFWHGREVETDNDFRAAMLELADCLMGKKR